MPRDWRSLQRAIRALRWRMMRRLQQLQPQQHLRQLESRLSCEHRAAVRARARVRVVWAWLPASWADGPSPVPAASRLPLTIKGSVNQPSCRVASRAANAPVLGE